MRIDPLALVQAIERYDIQHQSYKLEWNNIIAWDKNVYYEFNQANVKKISVVPAT